MAASPRVKSVTLWLMWWRHKTCLAQAALPTGHSRGSSFTQNQAKPANPIFRELFLPKRQSIEAPLCSALLRQSRITDRQIPQSKHIINLLINSGAFGRLENTAPHPIFWRPSGPFLHSQKQQVLRYGNPVLLIEIQICRRSFNLFVSFRSTPHLIPAEARRFREATAASLLGLIMRIFAD